MYVIKYSQILLHREVIGICRQSTGILKAAAGDACNNNNNDNNNSIYLLQLGCNPVAVVMLHVVALSLKRLR